MSLVRNDMLLFWRSLPVARVDEGIDPYKSAEKTGGQWPPALSYDNYFTLEVERRVTSWAPPSTMDTEDTRVSLASR